MRSVRDLSQRDLARLLDLDYCTFGMLPKTALAKYHQAAALGGYTYLMWDAGRFH